MCDFVGTCLEIGNLTPDEVKCLLEWLQGRHNDLQAEVTALQAQINDRQTRIGKVTTALARMPGR